MPLDVKLTEESDFELWDSNFLAEAKEEGLIRCFLVEDPSLGEPEPQLSDFLPCGVFGDVEFKAAIEQLRKARTKRRQKEDRALDAFEFLQDRLNIVAHHSEWPTESPKKMYDWIVKNYRSDARELLTVLQRLNQLSLGESSSFKEYIQHIKTYYSKLVELGQGHLEEDVKYRILDGLTPEYKDFVDGVPIWESLDATTRNLKNFYKTVIRPNIRIDRERKRQRKDEDGDQEDEDETGIDGGIDSEEDSSTSSSGESEEQHNSSDGESIGGWREDGAKGSDLKRKRAESVDSDEDSTTAEGLDNEEDDQELGTGAILPAQPPSMEERHLSARTRDLDINRDDVDEMLTI